MSERILIVEDQIEARNNLEEILSSSEYEVVSAENGAEAIKMLEKVVPDLIISDIVMPVMDGYQLLEYFQSSPSLSSIPFIFTSAKSSLSDINEGIARGAGDYITKPFRARDIIFSVRNRLEATQNKNKTREPEKVEHVTKEEITAAR